MKWTPIFRKIFKLDWTYNSFHMSYFYWIDIPSYNKIDKPMAIIGVVCSAIGNLFEQLNKK